MTTPYQGPGMWEQGNRDQALDWLANLDARQQQALQRAMNTHQALGPIYNAANRVRQLSIQTAQRLSEGAQQLAGQARQFGQNTAARAGEARDNATNRLTEFGQQAAGVYQRTRDTAVDGAQRAALAADLAAQATAERVNAAGRAVAETAQNTGRAIADTATTTGRAVVAGAQATGQAVVAGAQATGRAAVETGRRVSRWFQEKASNGQDRAQAARAAFAEFRKDPTLTQTNMSGKDISALSARAQALVSAQTPEARAAAAEQLIQAASSLQGAEQQGTGRHHADGQISAQWVTAGQPPAHLAAQQGQQQFGQGEAPKTGGQSQVQLNKGPEQGK
jgi:hypothetical protein